MEIEQPEDTQDVLAMLKYVDTTNGPIRLKFMYTVCIHSFTHPTTEMVTQQSLKLIN